MRLGNTDKGMMPYNNVLPPPKQMQLRGVTRRAARGKKQM